MRTKSAILPALRTKPWQVAHMLRRRLRLGHAERMRRARRLGADGNIRAAVGHRFRTACTGQTKRHDALLERCVLAFLDQSARMQRTKHVLALSDKFGASSLTPQTNFPDHTGHEVPGGHAPPPWSWRDRRNHPTREPATHQCPKCQTRQPETRLKNTQKSGSRQARSPVRISGSKRKPRARPF